MRKLAARLRGMTGEGAREVFTRAKELERQGRSIIHLELGEPDYHAAAPVVDAVRAAVAAGRDRYTASRGLPQLREAVAEYLQRTRKLKVTAENVLVADEIYARIVYGGGYHSISLLPGMAERTVILDGFSKSFAMTGWRLGCAAAPVKIIDALDLLVMNVWTSVNEFAQVAAIEALRDSTNAVEAMVGEYRKRRDAFAAGLNRVPGFRCLPPKGAFYAWVNVEETGLPAEELGRRL